MNVLLTLMFHLFLSFATPANNDPSCRIFLPKVHDIVPTKHLILGKTPNVECICGDSIQHNNKRAPILNKVGVLISVKIIDPNHLF